MAVEKNKSAISEEINALSLVRQKYTPFLRRCKEGGQNHRILTHLLTRGSITNAEAAENYQCYRLSARIKELRDMGVGIETEMIPSKTKNASFSYARYRLK